MSKGYLSLFMEGHCPSVSAGPAPTEAVPSHSSVCKDEGSLCPEGWPCMSQRAQRGGEGLHLPLVSRTLLRSALVPSFLASKSGQVSMMLSTRGCCG